MKKILIGLSAVLISASLGAAQVVPAKGAIAWDGPQIETKKKAEKAVVATTALIKRDDLVRGLEVIYGCAFNEIEQKFEQEIREDHRFDEQSKEMVTTKYTLQGLPKPLIKIIADYSSGFGCSRIVTVPDLGPKKINYNKDFESGMCASFINSNNMRIYIVECKNSGHFKLYDEKGKERAYCTAHTKPLTKIFVMPESQTQKRPYTFVTSSQNGSIRFWNEDGKEVGREVFGSGVCDFDIATNVPMQDKTADFLVVALDGVREIPVCDISNINHIEVRDQGIWGNVGVNRIKLLSYNNTLIAVTSEEAIWTDPSFRKEQVLCFYDVVRGTPSLRIRNFLTSLTRMDCIHNEKDALILFGDAQGQVQGLLFSNVLKGVGTSSEIEYMSADLKPFFTTQMPDRNPIVTLKAYRDGVDADCPHVVIQTLGSKGVSDINIRASAECRHDVEVITPPTKNTFYTGLGSGTCGRSAVLTCSPHDGQVLEWEHGKDLFLTELLLKGPTLEHISVTPPMSDQTESACCVIM